MTVPHPTSSTSAPRNPEVPTHGDTFIDWGPDLPDTFGSGRARLMVVNPTTLHLSWETAAESQLAAAEAWIAEVRVDGAVLKATFRVEGSPGKHTHNCWMSVEPKTSGFVRLLAVQNGQTKRVADLDFTTPAAGPSSDFAETWGSLDRIGGMRLDEAAVPGNRVEPSDAGPSPFSGSLAKPSAGN